MILPDAPQLGHLTYCTNIHPGETWPEVMANLETHLVAVRRQVAPGRPFGVGLRLSAVAAEALRDPATFEALQGFLRKHDLYVFTINGFPYGPFHRVRVKEEVYQPDWLHQERVVYSNLLGDLLAALLPDGMDGSISTVPGTFKPLGRAPEAAEAMTRNFVRHAAHLAGLRERTGRTIALALEPEPMCFLETIEETVAFFKQHLLSQGALQQFSELTGASPAEAEAGLRRHLGVCYDVCHAAVEFEDAATSIALLRAEGIAIPKLQTSAAVRLAEVTPEAIEQLRPFGDAVYLHQVVERRGDRLVRHLDLADAIEAYAAQGGAPAEWRVHFHVPVFLDRLEHFETTQGFLAEVLALHRKSPISRHLEAETYTWDVLPEPYRRVDVASAVGRELQWIERQLT